MIVHTKTKDLRLEIRILNMSIITITIIII